MVLLIYEKFAGGRDGGVSALTNMSEEKPDEFEALTKTGE